jgi:3-phenylpropionate/cinnamic acid dioxygenase small subunit
MNLSEEKDQIRDVLSNYCFYTDGGYPDRWVDLFTDDCQWDGGPFGVCGSKEELRAFIRQGGDAGIGMKHMTTNIVISLEGAQARARSYVLVLGKADQGNSILFAGHYDDVLVKTDGRWLIRSRKLRSDLSEFAIS